MMLRDSLLRSLVATVVVAFPLVVHADDEPDSASDAKPKVVTVKGVFEAIRSHELKADTEELSSLKIKRILPHGTRVNKGQNVVWFETEDVDKKIKEATATHRLAEITFEDDQFAYDQFIASQKLDRESAQRRFEQARQTFDNYVQFDRERMVESAHYSLKNARSSLENVREELEQLEQMYKEDDLTEESEEIVLKRAKHAVENAEYRLRGTEISTDRSINQSIPRSEAEQQDAFTRAEMSHVKAMRDLDVARRKRDIEMQQKRDKFKEAEKKFAKLKEERKHLVIRSPQEGILVHGKVTRGKISDKPSTLKDGSAATGSQVLATIVEPGRLQIRADLSENELRHVKAGAKGTVKVTAFPEAKAAATVKMVSAIPYAGTKYDCVLSVKLPKDAAVLPGMTCSVEFEIEASEDAQSDE